MGNTVSIVNRSNFCNYTVHSYKFRKKKDVPVLAYLIIDALCIILLAVAMVVLPIVVAAVACDGCDQAMTMAIILDIVLGISLGKSLYNII